MLGLGDRIQQGSGRSFEFQRLVPAYRWRFARQVVAGVKLRRTSVRWRDSLVMLDLRKGRHGKVIKSGLQCVDTTSAMTLSRLARRRAPSIRLFWSHAPFMVGNLATGSAVSVSAAGSGAFYVNCVNGNDGAQELLLRRGGR